MSGRYTYPLILQSGLSTGVVQLNYSIVNPLNESDMALLAALGQQLRMVGMENILTEICGLASLDSKEERYSINGQFSSEINQYVSVSASADIIHSEADSQAYFQGRVSRDTYQLTINTLVEPHEIVAFNFGFMLETDDYLNKVLFSPRISYHLKLTDTSSLRALYSQSHRSPDLHETDRQWQFTVDYADSQVDYLGRSSGTVFRLAETKAELKEETIRTAEIGFAHSGFKSNSTYDIKAFYEEMDDLISTPFTYLDFNLTNSGKVIKKGLESGWTYELNTLKFGAGYTYLEWNANNIYESTLSARHIGNFWAIKSLPWAAKLALSYSGFSGGRNGSYDRFEATYTQMLNVKDTGIQVQVGVKRYPEYTSVFTEYSATDPAQIGFSDRNRLFGKVKVAF